MCLCVVCCVFFVCDVCFYLCDVCVFVGCVCVCVVVVYVWWLCLLCGVWRVMCVGRGGSGVFMCVVRWCGMVFYVCGMVCV